MTATAEVHVAADWKQQIIADYPEAVVRLATLRAAKRQHLIFGWIELYPGDVSAPDGWTAGERPWPVPTTVGWTCSFSATRTSTVRALKWYEDLLQGTLVFVVDKDASPSEAVGSFGQEPALGRFVVHTESPFVFRWHDGPRVHRLVPLAPPLGPVRQLRNIPPAREWLKRNFSGFDVFENDEWIGAAALVAPNPLCSSVGMVLGREAGDGSESVVVQITPRRFKSSGVASLASLSIHLAEKHADGWSDLRTIHVPPSGQISVNFPEPVKEVASALVCQERGLLRLLEPHSWLRQTNVSTSVGTSRMTVQVPAGGRRKPASEYAITRYSPATSFAVGAVPDEVVQQNLRKRRAARIARVQREKADQRLLGLTTSKESTNPAHIVARREEAKAFVVDLISKARKRVMIVDPFFSHRDFREFALRTANTSVAVRVLTGWDVQNSEGDLGDPRIKNGHLFAADIAGIVSQIGDQVPQVRIMPGRKAVIHDRFLVVDADVWQFGPSFNELGERLGVAVKLPEPLSIRRMLSKIWCRSTPIGQFATLRPDDA